jgi:Rrf2 family protein
VRISAKADYAVRAMVQLAVEPANQPVKAELIAEAQEIPLRYLLAIMNELKHARLVRSSRGSGGGYQLSLSPAAISLADIYRVVEGPLVNIHESRVGELDYAWPAAALSDVWRAVRTNVRDVLESVTLADVAGGHLPARIQALADSYRADERVTR